MTYTVDDLLAARTQIEAAKTARTRAVRALVESGHPTRAIAQAVGVSHTSISNWGGFARPSVDGPRPTVLYRHFDGDGQLLYVGISSNPFRRALDHKIRSTWMKRAAFTTYEWFGDRESALAAERIAIAEENPAHNKQGISR